MFRELNLHPVYTSDEDNIARDFYIPVLRNAQTFNRTSAYFSARALAAYSEGLEYFSIHGQKYRLIISKDITEYDFKQLKAGYALRKKILDNMVGDFMESLTIAEEKTSQILHILLQKVLLT